METECQARWTRLGLSQPSSSSSYALSSTPCELLVLLSFSPGEASEQQEKKVRLVEGLSEKILHRPGPLELVKKNILPLDPGIKDAMTGSGFGCLRALERDGPVLCFLKGRPCIAICSIPLELKYREFSLGPEKESCHRHGLVNCSCASL